jgi:tetratricopeptide (TPR) repeat protein
MSYRYYLGDLCRLIEFMYQKRKKEEGDIAHTFYRADNINENQLKMMSKREKGRFISLLGFVSTTTDINIAKGYAEKQKVYEGNKRVLFVINVKPQLPCTAFAYIDRISFHPEEKEVLFSMGSSFVVDTISEPVNGENYYTINLIASEIDKSLVEDIRIKVENCSSSGRAVLLACYLVELEENRAARKYLTSLLTQAGDGGVLANDVSLAGVYSCLGITYARQGLHGDALKVFKQALNAQARLEYSNNNAIAEIHNNIGLAYVGLGHIDEAEATFAEAVRIQLREPRSNQQYLASIHSNIGYVHYKQKNFDEAEKSFRKAEKIYKQNTNRIAHDALELSLMKAEFLTNYGHLLIAHQRATDNRKPQDLYSEALKLYKGILSDSDPKLMRTYINIMLAFVQSKSYSEVTKYFNDPTVQKLINKQEANMFELNSSITQATLGSLYELIGACYASQDDFDKAIQVWKDAYVFERKARLEQLLLVTTDENSSILAAEHNRFIHEWYRKAAHHYTRLSR